MKAELRVKTLGAETESLLTKVGELSDHLDAHAELWVNDGRIFVDAPTNKCWSVTGNHTLTERLHDIETLLINMNAGFEWCAADCPFHSGGSWKPIKQPVTRTLNKKRKYT